MKSKQTSVSRPSGPTLGRKRQKRETSEEGYHLEDVDELGVHVGCLGGGDLPMLDFSTMVQAFGARLHLFRCGNAAATLQQHTVHLGQGFGVAAFTNGRSELAMKTKDRPPKRQCLSVKRQCLLATNSHIYFHPSLRVFHSTFRCWGPSTVVP